MFTLSGLIFLRNRLCRKPAYTHERVRTFNIETQVLTQMYFHDEYEITNGRAGYEIKSIPVESHGETLDDKEHQEQSFLPVLREHP